MEDGIVECGNFEGFISQLFSNSPKPPGTVRIDITNGDASTNNHKFTSHLLAEILVAGLVYKFGENVTFKDLSESDISLMKQYIQSLGFDFWINNDILNHNKNSLALPFVVNIPDGYKTQSIMFSIFKY